MVPCRLKRDKQLQVHGSSKCGATKEASENHAPKGASKVLFCFAFRCIAFQSIRCPLLKHFLFEFVVAAAPVSRSVNSRPKKRVFASSYRSLPAGANPARRDAADAAAPTSAATVRLGSAEHCGHARGARAQTPAGGDARGRTLRRTRTDSEAGRPRTSEPEATLRSRVGRTAGIRPRGHRGGSRLRHQQSGECIFLHVCI